jgi:type I restriction enzyme S subunit
MFPPTFCFAVPSGSVLLHSRNPKKVSILPFDAITGEKLFCLSPVDMTTLDSRFLAYQLQSDHFHEFVGRWLSGSVNKFLNWTALERYEFALPPIPEQEQIVAVMMAQANLNDGYREAANCAEALFYASLQNVFNGIPSSAVSVPLGDIAEVQLGRMLSADRATGSDLAPYIKNTNIQWAGLDLEHLPKMSFPLGERTRYALCAGDILVCEGGDVGRSVLLEQDLPGIYYQKAVHRIRTSEVDPRFLHLYLVFAYRSGELKKLSTGTAIPHLPAERFRKLRVPIASQGFQEAVVGKLLNQKKVIESAKSAHYRGCRLATALFQRMIGDVHSVH